MQESVPLLTHVSVPNADDEVTHKHCQHEKVKLVKIFVAHEEQAVRDCCRDKPSHALKHEKLVAANVAEVLRKVVALSPYNPRSSDGPKEREGHLVYEYAVKGFARKAHVVLCKVDLLLYEKLLHLVAEKFLQVLSSIWIHVRRAILHIIDKLSYVMCGRLVHFLLIDSFFFFFVFIGQVDL